MKTSIRKLGADCAIVIPEAILARLTLPTDEVDIALENDALVIRAAQGVHAVSVQAPLETGTPVWDDFNAAEEWTSLAEVEARGAGPGPA